MRAITAIIMAEKATTFSAPEGRGEVVPVLELVDLDELEELEEVIVDDIEEDEVELVG